MCVHAVQGLAIRVCATAGDPGLAQDLMGSLLRPPGSSLPAPVAEAALVAAVQLSDFATGEMLAASVLATCMACRLWCCRRDAWHGSTAL
jgi:hypothetical protein